MEQEGKADQEAKVEQRAKAEPMEQSHSVGDSDVSSSLDSAELKWGEHVEMEDEDEREMTLAQSEFTGLWEHKDYTAASDETIQLETSYTSIKTDMKKSLVSKVPKNTVKSRDSKGPPFISKPEIVLFKDCNVGKIYKKKVTLTNVTYMTNYCKLLGVSQNLKDYVSFEPPGPMSAGMTCELEVIFKPLVSGKTASAEMPSVNAENTVQIPSDTENTGRASHVDLKPGVSPVSSHSPNEVLMADPGSVDTTVEQSFEPTEFSIGEAYEGDVDPFMSVKLPIIFTPTIPGEAKLDFQITFSQPSCEPIVVSVCGVAEIAPVWVTEPNIDLKICMYDRLYQDSIKVQSRASTALRLTFKVCKEMRNHMSILPKTGFIQAKSSFSAQLKFLPRQSLYADAKSFFNKDTGVLEVPLTVQVADQNLAKVLVSSGLQPCTCRYREMPCTNA
ncbi:hypothetical protein QQF64_031475 [Cirrhinus molitorella]|uniref:CFAP74 third Ig-like domain-containing protein n=1 Tax=Cirrhinus molitorella TaxID=172907 RepID=A0ABR3MX13_9TELE